jgi:hypothetical protein
MYFFFLRVKKNLVSHPFKTAFNRLYSEILHNIRWTRRESLVKNGLSLSSRRGVLNSIENNFSSVAGHPNLSPAPDHEFALRCYIASVNKCGTCLLQISPIYTSVLLKLHALMLHCCCNSGQGMYYEIFASRTTPARTTAPVLSRGSLHIERVPVYRETKFQKRI